MKKGLEMIGVLSLLLSLTAFGASAAGQAKGTGAAESGNQPPAPAQPYLVLTGASLGEVVKQLQAGDRTQNLVTGEGIGCRVFVQHEKDVATGQAEVHEGADDIFLILEGTATLTLGGTLVSPKLTSPGEWRAAEITGGKEVKLAKGDMVAVPRGTPHRRTTGGGQEVTLMVIKSFTPAAK